MCQPYQLYQLYQPYPSCQPCQSFRLGHHPRHRVGTHAASLGPPRARLRPRLGWTGPAWYRAGLRIGGGCHPSSIQHRSACRPAQRDPSPMVDTVAVSGGYRPAARIPGDGTFSVMGLFRRRLSLHQPAEQSAEQAQPLHDHGALSSEQAGCRGQPEPAAPARLSRWRLAVIAVWLLGDPPKLAACVQRIRLGRCWRIFPATAASRHRAPCS